MAQTSLIPNAAPYGDPLYWNARTIREEEVASIREFVEAARGYLRGKVLDYGCGRPGTCRVPEPYRDLVVGEYVGCDRDDPLPKDDDFDAVLCTQVLQYLEYPQATLTMFRGFLKESGKLVMTYPTNWDSCEDEDLWRFTRHGMERMLRISGFQVLAHELRAAIELGGFYFQLGYGVVAKKI